MELTGGTVKFMREEGVYRSEEREDITARITLLVTESFPQLCEVNETKFIHFQEKLENMMIKYRKEMGCS